MKVIPTEIADVKIIEPAVFSDDRGYFLETWNAASFARNGLDVAFVQDNQSRSKKHVLRGLHYQLEQTQGKLVRVVKGAVFDVAVDIRKSSPSFGRWVGVELTEDNHRMLWVPAGFAHGFLALTDDVDLTYKCTDFYAARHERTIVWNDPRLAIAWPLAAGAAPLVSPKDAAGSTFADADLFRMNVLLVGSGGQLGTALQATRPGDITLVARDYPEIDLGDADAVAALVSEVSPALILNAAAYTAVDKAETETELAFRINAHGVGALARAAQSAGARLIHVSTDYVFDGTKGHPYLPDDPPTPASAYGKSKLAGEREALAAAKDCLIVRTAWLYHEVGANFVKTMLRVMASRPEIRVVCDQVGTPTYAGSLAEALWVLARGTHRGILHYTDSGVASWYDFACAIQEEALQLGLLEKAVPILPISTAEYPLPAPRPVFGVLDKSETSVLVGKPADHWRRNLRVMLERMKNG